jgi:hypothetical protein
MAARSFEDSTGIVWEVFEVHRASEKPGAVSAGLEKGWLAFVSTTGKRRLAPFPPGWVSASPTELERLCASARKALPPSADARERKPHIRRRRPASPDSPDSQTEGSATPRAAGAARRASAPADVVEARVSGTTAEEVVRDFARRARAAGVPAIEAMVRLKTLLLARFPGSDSEARDLRSVRRWFVEAYYFESEAGDRQSR